MGESVMALEMPRSPNSKVEKEDDGFLVHVFQLAQMRDATMEKMRVDQQRLVQLGNLLNASIETKELREQSDLEVAKMIVNWWRALVETDVVAIDREVKAENEAILRFWNAKMNRELRSRSRRVPKVPYKEKLEELECMMASITVMKERLEEALHVLERALIEATAPGSLLEITLQKVLSLNIAQLQRSLHFLYSYDMFRQKGGGQEITKDRVAVNIDRAIGQLGKYQVGHVH